MSAKEAKWAARRMTLAGDSSATLVDVAMFIVGSSGERFVEVMRDMLRVNAQGWAGALVVERGQRKACLGTLARHHHSYWMIGRK